MNNTNSYTNILTQNGGKVTGCDGSNEVIKHAKATDPAYQFDVVHLLEDIPYEENRFDRVFCNLVFMHIEPISKFISEVYHMTKNRGSFFFLIVHPAFYRADE